MTRIEWDGTVQRRMVDTADRIDGAQWEKLAARALAILPLCRPVPRIPVYRVRVDDAVVQAAEHDLTSALLDLITAVLALDEELLPARPAGFRRPFTGPGKGARAGADAVSGIPAQPCGRQDFGGCEPVTQGDDRR